MTNHTIKHHKRNCEGLHKYPTILYILSNICISINYFSNLKFFNNLDNKFLRGNSEQQQTNKQLLCSKKLLTSQSLNSAVPPKIIEFRIKKATQRPRVPSGNVKCKTAAHNLRRRKFERKNVSLCKISFMTFYPSKILDLQYS